MTQNNIFVVNPPINIHMNGNGNGINIPHTDIHLPEILFITSYPPRECGIATYSKDLIKALNNKFNQSFRIKICALESKNEKHNYSNDHLPYGQEVKYIINTDHLNAFIRLGFQINRNDAIRIVLIQHEFGFFEKKEDDFIQFLNSINKPIVIVCHTVLPQPNKLRKAHVQQILSKVESVIVMTNSSLNILINDYGIAPEKITVIPHGTHLVPHSDKSVLKEKYDLSGRKVLATFGLLSSGKSIETTLDALPAVIKEYEDVLFLIIGKTHPSIVKQEGEKYRQMLQSKVDDLKLQQHVYFINDFLPLPDLLEYLQLTDIYLFTSKDPHQAVSGTFSYAISSGCPVISTPIPHACEVLGNDAGIIIDFQNSEQLSKGIINLLKDESLRKNMSSNGLHRIASTAWENSAIAHALLFEKTEHDQISLKYNLPEINLDHIKKLTTDFGMVQFSKINQPDIDSGYTLDDNARAMIAMCQHFELSGDENDVSYIYIYLNFIKHCLQTDGYFLNYVDKDAIFTQQNNQTNLEDAHGRAIWALGYLIHKSNLFPEDLILQAKEIIQQALLCVNKIHSTRAIAFTIKGLYYYNLENKSYKKTELITILANKLVQMYLHEMDDEWRWFESYLTYANSILPEAMLCAWAATDEIMYREIAQSSFDFLLSMTFSENRIKVISNKSWLQKGAQSVENVLGGEQPIDVAYSILALSKFYDVFKEEEYMNKMTISFAWFLGNNHLHQIIYNPCTGGCYDGLEENYVNLNQGAESTVSYLMARLTVEKYANNRQKSNLQREPNLEFSLQNQLVLA